MILVDENETMPLSSHINYDSEFTRVCGEIIIFGPTLLLFIKLLPLRCPSYLFIPVTQACRRQNLDVLPKGCVEDFYNHFSSFIGE
jgi:hypothetical protein